ncbi:MAG TPA: F0F1 ATP synthase subunit B [Acidimicrobiales bacterium]|nr:F0F1 ATP synthase subunit B [Acidimicrobiales bacterium]
MRIRALTAAVMFAVLSVFAFGRVAVAQEGPPQEGQEESKATHAGEECIEILEKGGKAEECHDAPSPIIPETKEIVWGSISFLALLFLMSKFAYPALKKSMDARTAKIRGNLDDAERVKAEAAKVLEDYKRQLADARNESNRIIEEARQTADQLRRDLMQRAEAEVAELRQKTRDDISAAQERAMADLQSRVGDMAIELAGKVVEANLDRDANIRLIDSYIAQVGSSS